MGYAADEAQLHQRIDVHYAASPGDGQHHRLVVVARQAGISFTLARVWLNATRADERRMKANGKSWRCPICRDERRRSA
jgi:hypothetical protein